MKFATLFAFIFLIAFISGTMQKAKKIIFFGDSITEQGNNLGGYIIRMKEMLADKGVSSGYALTGAGVGGNKIYDLYLRMDEDVMAKDPDVVVIWIGVNDVWHK